ncbi:MAG: hypothetical protein NTW19_10400 [Planctomycetota bacterium]|nr:hypothetical protein [Planctomycetota bacterium]
MAEASPATPPAPDVIVQVRVPAGVNPQFAQLAVVLGVQVINMVRSGVTLICYPKVIKGQDGKPGAGLGQFAMPVREADDVKRLLMVGN